MKPVDAGDVAAEIVAALAAVATCSAGVGAVDRNQLACRQAGHAGSDALDHAGGFGADDKRQVALGERHAAPAPDVDMVQRDRADPDGRLTGAGIRGDGYVGNVEPPVSGQLQCTHRLPKLFS